MKSPCNRMRVSEIATKALEDITQGKDINPERQRAVINFADRLGVDCDCFNTPWVDPKRYTSKLGRYYCTCNPATKEKQKKTLGDCGCSMSGTSKGKKITTWSFYSPDINQARKYAQEHTQNEGYTFKNLKPTGQVFNKKGQRTLRLYEIDIYPGA